MPFDPIEDGDVWSGKDAEFIRGATGARGVMSARGLLTNPVCYLYRWYYALGGVEAAQHLLCRPFL